MSYYNNQYDQPENFDLTLVGSIDFSDACYQFDLVAVWRDESGNLYYASDSGCSCPSPFEDYDDVSKLTPCTWMELNTYLTDRCSESDESERAGNDASVVNLMARVTSISPINEVDHVHPFTD